MGSRARFIRALPELLQYSSLIQAVHGFANVYTTLGIQDMTFRESTMVPSRDVYELSLSMGASARARTLCNDCCLCGHVPFATCLSQARGSASFIFRSPSRNPEVSISR